MDKQKIALVLSTGGARGIAHIGVIEELERLNYEITSVAGCSMGALVGAAYAAGRLKELKETILSLNARRVLGLMDFTLFGPGLLKGNRVMKKIAEIVPDRRIEELRIPYTATATDLRTGREVVFRQGSLHEAIRASISLPLFFRPFLKEGQAMVDGGVSDPLPLQHATRCEGDLLVGSIAYDAESQEADGLTRKLTKVSVVHQMMTVMVQSSIRHSVQAARPDFVVRSHTNDFSIFRFDKAEEFIEQGRLAVHRAGL